jgi:hypothetical protein
MALTHETTVGEVIEIVYTVRLSYPSLPDTGPYDYQIGYFGVAANQSGKSAMYADSAMVPILLPVWLKAYDPHTNWWVTRRPLSGTSSMIGAHTAYAIPVFSTSTLAGIGYTYSGLRTGNNLPYNLAVVAATMRVHFHTGVIPAEEMPANAVKLEHAVDLAPNGWSPGGAYFNTQYSLPGQVEESATLTAVDFGGEMSFGVAATDDWFGFNWTGLGDTSSTVTMHRWWGTESIPITQDWTDSMRMTDKVTTPALAVGTKTIRADFFGGGY